MPFGVPGWKWKVGRFGYVMGNEPSYEEIRAGAKGVLEKATKGPAWHCRCGTFHVPLLVDGEIVGELWEDVEPRELEVGAYWDGKWGTKVQLVKDGKLEQKCILKYEYEKVKITVLSKYCRPMRISHPPCVPRRQVGVIVRLFSLGHP